MDQIGGHVAENTLSARLANMLKEKGIQTADFERVFPTFKGTRKPDVPFQTERGLCFVSAKLGANKEADAIASAQEYQHSIGEVTNVAEAFSLTYPLGKEKTFHLRVLANQQHGSFSWILSSLNEVADKIIEIAHGEFKKAEAGKESTITSSIRVLRSGVIGLSSVFTRTPPEDFEDLFGGKHFFETVIGYDQIGKNKEKVLKSAAAYIFVNQILFYEILSREIKDYPPITNEDISKPNSLKPKYFDLVLKVDYRPIFNFDIASKIRGKEAGDSCKQIILAIRALFPDRIDHDVIGKVFHGIIPLEIRKVVAAYFTNNAAGDLLARLSIHSEGDKVLDPACGSGTLLVSAYKRKLELSDQNPNKSLYKKYVEKELTGIDVMPFSAHLAAVNLALLGLPNQADNIRIAIDDSTPHWPGDKIEPAREVLKEAFKPRLLADYIDGKPQRMNVKTKAGAVTLHDKDAKPITLEEVNVVIMNPPFTSCDNLPADYKKILQGRFINPPAHAKCLTGKLSFQAYFLLLADRFVLEGGRIACVIPLTTLVAKAFDQLTDFLVSNYTVQYVVVGLGRSAFSDQTALTEILLVAQKRKPTAKHQFALVATKTTPTDWTKDDVESIAKEAENSFKTGKNSEDNLSIIKNYPQEELRQNKLTLTGMINQLDSKFLTLQNKLSRIYQKSGIVSNFMNFEKKMRFEIFEGGAFAGIPIEGYSAISYSATKERMKKQTDKFLIKKETKADLIVENKDNKQTFRISKEYVCPQIRRLTAHKTIDIASETDYVVYRNFEELEEIMKTLYPQKQSEHNIRELKSEGFYKIASQRSNITFTRRINISAPGTKIIAVYSEIPAFVAANAWGIKNIGLDQAKLLSLWMNSGLFLLELLTKRVATQGSFGQIDKRYLYAMSCPDFTSLLEKQTSELLKTFERLSAKPLPSILEQVQTSNEIKKQIDKQFLSVFGVDDQKEQDEILFELYQILSRRISAQKDTMSMD
jgi:hypothetical protein